MCRIDRPDPPPPHQGSDGPKSFSTDSLYSIAILFRSPFVNRLDMQTALSLAGGEWRGLCQRQIARAHCDSDHFARIWKTFSDLHYMETL